MLEFIKKIEFKKGDKQEENLFPPFKGGDKIFFDGKIEVTKLIEFYLKDKKIKDSSGNIITPKQNAERFKINCVLGNNGGGKTSLFKGILSGKISLDKKTDKENIFFDTFANLEPDIKESVNKNLIKENNRNGFYSSFFNFKFKNILLKGFFQKNINTFIGIDGFKDIDFTNGFTTFDEFNFFIKKLKKYNIFYYNYIKGRKQYPIFDKRNFKIKEKLSDLFILNYIVEAFQFIIKEEKDIVKEVDEYIKDIEGKNFLYINGLKDSLSFYINLIESLDIKNKITNEYNKIKEYKSSIEDIKKIRKNFLGPRKFDFIEINKNDEYSLNIFNLYFDIKLKFVDSEVLKFYDDLSSGEKMILSRMMNTYMGISKKFDEFKEKLRKEGKTKEQINKKYFETVILIDEPDLHLHLDWQKQYIQKLIDVFSTLDKNIKLHFIIATHSPFMISDLPIESIIVLDGKGSKTNDTEFTKIKTYNGTDINDEKKNGMKFEKYSDVLKFERNNNLKKKTFGANFIDIIRDGFFFEDEILMGSFAENVIHQVAESERRKIFLASLKFQLEYKKHEKENIQGQIKEINLFELKEVFEKLKDETKDILEPILKLILEDGFKKYDKKEDILEEIKSNYKNIKNLKNNWIKVKNEKIDEEINKIKKDIKSINEEIKGYENNIQENIGDDFLRDNLLYFKGKNND